MSNKEGNEYIEQEAEVKVEKLETKEPSRKTEKKSNKKSSNKKTKQKNTSKVNLLKPIQDLFDEKNRRLNLTVGSILSLFALYQILAFISYLFTWKLDQNLVINKSFGEFIFGDSEGIEIANHLGKLGAWISHKFIYDWFGISSFLFPLMFITLGLFLLFRVKILPIGRTVGHSIIGIVVISLCLGFITTGHSFPYGGAFGFEFNAWLKATLGVFGAFMFLAVLLFVTVVLMFNPDFRKLWSKLFPEKQKSETEAVEHEGTGDLDIKVVNTIKDDQIEQDLISEEITFGEDEGKDEGEDEELEITINEDESEELEIENEIDEEESNDTEVDEDDSDENFEVEVAAAETEVSDKDINKKLEEFGEYDEKLDLSSYKLPTIDLLEKHGSGNLNINKEELEENKNRIVEALGHYKIEISKIKATVGPTVTLYEIVPAPGVRISKIKNLSDDIALSLAANGIRIIAPIPGKGTIGIEVPNSTAQVVSMRSMIASEKFQNTDMALPIVLGKTISNETFIFDLAKAPHLLAAGATGQGKSVGINAILVSLLYKKHPAQIKFVLVDPKKVELTLYNKIERHFLAKLPDSEEAIITDTSKVVNTMNSLCIEMDERYDLLKNAHVRNIKEYNKKFSQRKLNPENGHRYLPYIVVVIDEFADLIMTAGKEIEHPIARLAQLARAIGIHLIVATQRPSVNVITGMIKANFPARIAFRVSSKIDSRTILDAGGADQLIGRGDMLISFGNDITRLQCAFVDTPEVEAICEYIGDQRAYPEAMMLPEYVGEEQEGPDVNLDDRDDLFDEAARILVTHQQGSASLLQRKLSIGYNRAGRIIDQMEAAGIIGPFKGSKAREVLITDLPSLELFLADLK
ncbi:DNA translocase FtsK [Paracrocinitomix mangrovi]|uniref:FtsK/SpoIIIE family DNA translocase n=1 Tax=Paracrocinitomix mangrovi TaxID=2862509 RepID=UPI001C8EC1C6|nr:DNA translocase FtsK [Paracrocinitomix mangrovi]UKN02538.1 DNA translocase FtsK [Paracrocinitomix mangrovi]